MSKHYRCDRCGDAIILAKAWGRIYRSQDGPPYHLCGPCIRAFHKFMARFGIILE